MQQLIKKQLPSIALFVVFFVQVCLTTELKTSSTVRQNNGKSSIGAGDTISGSGSSTSSNSNTNNNNSNIGGAAAANQPVTEPLKFNSSTLLDTFLDDDEFGSGSHGSEIHEDLEKEHENSGSGFGPDDEDTRPRVHKPHHQSSTPKYSTDHSSHKQPESSTPDLDDEIGSGDGSRLNFDDDDGDGDDDDGREDGERNQSPTAGTGDDFTTEVKQTDVDPSTIDEGDSKEDDIDDGDYDDPIKPIFEEPKAVDEVPAKGIHQPDQTTVNKETTTDKSEADGDDDDSGEDKRKDIQFNNNNNQDVSIQTRDDDRTASFFAQPGILAAVIGGAVVGLLCAILVVMFIVYRMRKKDEGSYPLEEPKRAPASYAKGANNREFFA